jgi:Ca-activated chloride channel family protein
LKSGSETHFSEVLYNVRIRRKRLSLFAWHHPVLGAGFRLPPILEKKKQREFGDWALVRKLSPEKSVFKPILKFTLLMLALAALVIGLVNPKIGTKMETVKREGIDIVFAVDVSKSMLAEDVAPSRLDKSKQIVSQIINQLGNDRIGIVAYAGSAFPVLPITTDYGVAKMFLQSMNTTMVSRKAPRSTKPLNCHRPFLTKATRRANC